MVKKDKQEVKKKQCPGCKKEMTGGFSSMVLGEIIYCKNIKCKFAGIWRDESVFR